MRLLTAFCFCAFLFAQVAAGPHFEAAAIKPVPAPEGIPHLVQNAGGIDYPAIWPFNLLMRAWNLQNYELSFPDGFRQRWSVVARAPANTAPDQIPIMLQNLLIDRFQLRFHRQTREISAYVLVPAKGGPKLRSTETTAGGLSFGRSPKSGTRVSGNVTLDTLAFAISSAMDNRPVINQTGLTGVYEIEFDYEPDNATPGDPNLQHALEDTLGLRLEYRKVPISIFVVDHIANTPTDN